MIRWTAVILAATLTACASDTKAPAAAPATQPAPTIRAVPSLQATPTTSATPAPSATPPLPPPPPCPLVFVVAENLFAASDTMCQLTTEPGCQVQWAVCGGFAIDAAPIAAALAATPGSETLARLGTSKQRMKGPSLRIGLRSGPDATVEDRFLSFASADAEPWTPLRLAFVEGMKASMARHRAIPQMCSACPDPSTYCVPGNCHGGGSGRWSTPGCSDQDMNASCAPRRKKGEACLRHWECLSDHCDGPAWDPNGRCD